MKKDRLRWDEKYRKKKYSRLPTEIVTAYNSLAPNRYALDIAAGNGRNSVYLAEQGFLVDALDISEVGLRQFSSRHPGVRPACVDLDSFDLPENRYGLIINIRFLLRRLLPMMIAALVPEGVLIFESFLESPDLEMWQPSRREYLLRRNELRNAFSDLQILHYRETIDPEYEPEVRRIASMVAVKK